MTTPQSDQGSLEFILDEARKQAHSLYQAGQWRELEVLAKGILAVDPRDAWTLSLYGSMLRRQRKFREAAALIEAAHALDPDNVEIAEMRKELVAFANRVAATKATVLQ